jgi:hypothetical protein
MFLAQVHLLTPDIRVELTTSELETVRVIANGNQIWQGIPKKWVPWKLTGGDIDGNGHPDFAVGIVKQTHLYPHPHKTIFFYEYRRGEIWPKWRGSSLAMPIEDFAYGISSKGPRLLALQTDLERRYLLAIWRWHQFGFRLESRHGSWKHAKFGKIERQRVEIINERGSVWVKL